MPRSMSTLLQCILNQNSSIAATPTDPVLEYLYGARMNYTNTPEVKAIDTELAVRAWRGFCWGGLKGYSESYSNRPHLCIKTRGGTIHYRWFEAFMPYKPKMICMVRDLKSIMASMEKIYRKRQESHQSIQNHSKMTGTSTAKRVVEWSKSVPVGMALERMEQCFLESIDQSVLYIRAEDLTTNPFTELNRIYNYLGLPPFSHDFDNVEQSIKEDDAVYGLTPDLHTIRRKISPVKIDYEEILGKDVCLWIDNNFQKYQQQFGYI